MGIQGGRRGVGGNCPVYQFSGRVVRRFIAGHPTIARGPKNMALLGEVSGVFNDA